MKRIILIFLSIILFSSSANYNYQVYAETQSNYLLDVNKDDWYYNHVMKIYSKGIMREFEYTDGNIYFGANEKVTRGMFVTMLYRINNVNVKAQPLEFSDVNENDYYYIPLSWAINNDIMHGYGNTTQFGGNDYIKRQDVIVTLYNWAIKSNPFEEVGSIEEFKDYENVSDYAVDAMKWAVGNNVIDGTSDHNLKPSEYITRAEMAKILDNTSHYFNIFECYPNEFKIDGVIYNAYNRIDDWNSKNWINLNDENCRTIINNTIMEMNVDENDVDNFGFDVSSFPYDHSLELNKGIGFYSSKQEVIAAYGQPSISNVDNREIWTYPLSKTNMQLGFEDGLLVSVRWSKNNNSQYQKVEIDAPKTMDCIIGKDYYQTITVVGNDKVYVQYYNSETKHWELVGQHQVNNNEAIIRLPLTSYQELKQLYRIYVPNTNNHDGAIAKIIVNIQKHDTYVSGQETSPSVKASTTYSDEIKVEPLEERLVYLQFYNPSKKIWENKAEYTTDAETGKVKIIFTKEWYSLNNITTKWRYYLPESAKAKKKYIDITIKAKRAYQNPSGALQIKNNITLSGGGYNLSNGYMGLKVARVQRKLGMGQVWEQYGSSTMAKVKAFQKYAGLRVTGVVDKTTWNRMGLSSSEWYNLGQYVSPLKINIASSKSDCIDAMIERAYEYIGTEYIVGASGKPKQGVDCSGLVMQCLYSAGVDLSPINPVRHSRPGYEFESANIYRDSRLMSVSLSDRQRGDLIFYYNHYSGNVNHVAIYIGNDKVIDAMPDSKGVAIRDIKDYSHYYIKGVKRVFR